jgi:hypothetical protein
MCTKSIRPLVPSGVKVRIRVESGSPGLKLIERQDWTISLDGMAASVTPLMLPPNALKGDPDSVLMATGAPVISAWVAGFR